MLYEFHILFLWILSFKNVPRREITLVLDVWKAIRAHITVNSSPQTLDDKVLCPMSECVLVGVGVTNFSHEFAGHPPCEVNNLTQQVRVANQITALIGQ